MLCTGLMRISSPVRSKVVNESSRSGSYSVAMLREERGRRTLTAALSRHMVGRRISVGIGDPDRWIYTEQDPNDGEMIDCAVRQQLYGGYCYSGEVRRGMGSA